MSKRERAGYHHGNLRHALLEAARRLIEEKGTSGFTLAEAARTAGVSAAAPYRHFKDRSDILGALAVEGFDAFADQLEAAWQDGEPEPIDAFLRVGRAYLTFAVDESAAYRAMFDTSDAAGEVAGLRRASGRAFDVLRNCVAALLERMPAKERPPVDLVAVHVWALTHGTATLFAENNPGRGRVPISGNDILESSVLVYLRGLGILPR
ncbi:MAG: TetR/AcrR family transcriptional regulator [Pseudomonadota bacterium]